MTTRKLEGACASMTPPEEPARRSASAPGDEPSTLPGSRRGALNISGARP